ncbi:hypothetical protein QUF90_01320 [Desulfococcaceae bacterium HSG9]|nr:hypothetical protein [Desulfococcaceae bacterium HSG9]
MRGYKKGRFSFNVKGGRCEDCRSSVDGKCLKIRHGAQKLSEAVFCRPEAASLRVESDAKNRCA